MILRGKQAAQQYAYRFALERVVIQESGYLKHQEKKILKHYDQNIADMLKYLESKIIVFKYHNSRLWDMNFFWIAGPKGVSVILYNTATRHIEAVLRELGKVNGWMKA